MWFLHIIKMGIKIPIIHYILHNNYNIKSLLMSIGILKKYGKVKE